MASDKFLDWLKFNENYFAEPISDEERSSFAAMEAPIRSLLGLPEPPVIPRKERMRLRPFKVQLRLSERARQVMSGAAALLVVGSFLYYLSRISIPPRQEGGKNSPLIVKENPLPKQPSTVVDTGKAAKDTPPVDLPKNTIVKTPADQPPPLVVKDTVGEDLMARIKPYTGKRPNPDDPKVIALRDEVGRFLKELPKPNIPAPVMVAFFDASTQTPEHRKLYCETRAEQLRNSDKNSPEVSELRKTLLGFRFSKDNRSCFSSLKDFLERTNPDDPATRTVEWKPQVASLIERVVIEASKIEERSPKIVGQNEPLDPAKKHGPYLLCVLPPDLRGEANNLYTEIQRYASRPENRTDPELLDFLMRSRPTIEKDKIRMVFPGYEIKDFKPGTDTGKANWKLLIDSRASSVPIAAAVRIESAEIKDMQAPIIWEYARLLNEVRQPVNTKNIKRPSNVIIYAFIHHEFYANADQRFLINQMAQTKSDIDHWLNLVGDDNTLLFGGFLIAYSSPDDLKSLYSYIRNEKRIGLPIIYLKKTSQKFNLQDLMTNRQIASDKNFIICFDGEGKSVNNFNPEPWLVNYEPSRFCGIFLEGHRNDLTASVEHAAAKHLGSVFFYINELKPPDYWWDEITEIQRLNTYIMGSENAASSNATQKKAARPKGK